MVVIIKPAAQDQYERLLEIIYHQSTGCLKPTLDLIQLTWDQFGRFFRCVGEVYSVYQDQNLAGLCWVEVRRETLHLHGLVLKDEFQGKGIGTQALRWLEHTWKWRVTCIQLDVHESNRRAVALYERLGYRPVNRDVDTGFYCMQKVLEEAEVWKKSNSSPGC